MANLTKEQLVFLWGYALERGHLRLGRYHEMADEHGVDRVKTMILARLAMDDMTDELMKVQLPGDLPPPPPWPFDRNPAEILTELRNAKADEDSFQSDR